MIKRSVLKTILSIGTVSVLPAAFVVLQAKDQFIAGCAYMSWLVRICVVVLIMLCVLFLLLTYKDAALVRQAEQEIKQEAEQLFVGDCREPRQEDTIMLDKAGSPQMDRQELFKTELN